MKRLTSDEIATEPIRDGEGMTALVPNWKMPFEVSAPNGVGGSVPSEIRTVGFASPYTLPFLDETIPTQDLPDRACSRGCNSVPTAKEDSNLARPPSWVFSS